MSASSGSCAASPMCRTGSSSSTRIATRRSTSRCRASPSASQATSGKHLVIGVSGGLDSTHALIVAAKVCDYLKLPRSTILGFTMPGFATGDTTKGNAWALMKALGIVGEEIDIKPGRDADAEATWATPSPRASRSTTSPSRMCRRGFAPTICSASPTSGGFVVGTGDLSELALGWCTYGVGDQMSHYGVNAGVPKTLIQYLIRWAVKTEPVRRGDQPHPQAILDTKISPELVPARRGGMQSTEDRIGPYELHDFFLFHILRSGQPPSKVAFLAWQAWQDREGAVAVRLSRAAEARLRSGDDPQVAGRVPVPLLPDQPVQALGAAQFAQGLGRRQLSPRGDWRAPSDGVAGPWLDELKEAFSED
jgi:NAD+ synthase (glutamine-hydrolysing)